MRRAGRKTLYMAGGVQMFSAQASPIILIGFQTLTANPDTLKNPVLDPKNQTLKQRVTRKLLTGLCSVARRSPRRRSWARRSPGGEPRLSGRLSLWRRSYACSRSATRTPTGPWTGWCACSGSLLILPTTETPAAPVWQQDSQKHVQCAAYIFACGVWLIMHGIEMHRNLCSSVAVGRCRRRSTRSRRAPPASP